MQGNCVENKTAYDCLKSGCEYAEAWEGVFFCHNPKIALIGGNPKGYTLPFHPDTQSGKRLRMLISEIGLDCELADMTINTNDTPTIQECQELLCRYGQYKVVFLGRFVEKQLRRYFPNAYYLPHPASRRKIDRIRLKEGLELLKRRTTK